VGAQLIQRRLVQPKVLLTISLSIVAASMWYYSTFTLTTDYRHYALARALQGLGYGFFFVPVNIIAYSQLRPDQNNKASSLTNFFRNWGGSFGIALMTTVADRRQGFHQTHVGSAISATSQQFSDRAAALTSYLIGKGFTGPDAAAAAQSGILRQLERQVSLLAFMDCFRILAWLTLATIPMILLIRHFRPASTSRSGH
jgi:DHA2 family multidrug resistance protein